MLWTLAVIVIHLLLIVSLFRRGWRSG